MNREKIPRRIVVCLFLYPSGGTWKDDLDGPLSETLIPRLLRILLTNDHYSVTKAIRAEPY